MHVWLYVIDTNELLLQQRSEFKESWASLWDISVAGHSAFLHAELAELAASGIDGPLCSWWKTPPLCRASASAELIRCVFDSQIEPT